MFWEIGGFQKIENCPTIDFPTWFALAGIGKFAYAQSYLGYFRRHFNAYVALTKKYLRELRNTFLKGKYIESI